MRTVFLLLLAFSTLLQGIPLAGGPCATGGADNCCDEAVSCCTPAEEVSSCCVEEVEVAGPTIAPRCPCGNHAPDEAPPIDDGPARYLTVTEAEAVIHPGATPDPELASVLLSGRTLSPELPPPRS